MSGHSKWSTIKRKKGKNDAKRGAVFTRLAREITVAARNGGADPEINFALRLAVDRAKTENMPKDNIERAIKRGTGEVKDGADLEEIIYEAYATHGIGVMIEVVTDNRNRTVSDIKHVINKAGGNMAEPGSVSWQFEQKGYIALPNKYDFDDIFLIVAEAGAEDVTESVELIEVSTPRELLQIIQETLKEAGIEIEDALLEWVPKAEIELEVAQAVKVMNVIELLDELDDTQAVYSNLAVTDEVIVQLQTEAT